MASTEQQIFESSVPDESISSKSSTGHDCDEQDGSQIERQPTHQEEVLQKMSKFHEVLFLLMMVSAQLMTQVGVGGGIAPLFIIGNYFHQQDPGKLSWYMASYSLTVGTFILSAGRLGDIYGHKKMFIFGYSWYTLWALLAGISSYSGEIFYDVCRGLQGIGPAFLLPNALAILGRTYPPGKKRNFAFAAFGACAPGGSILGSTFASIFAQYTHWGWVYWSLCMATAILAFGAYFIIPRDELDPGMKSQKFDYFGALLGIGGLVLINVAWNQGPGIGWNHASVYTLLIVGAAMMAAFVVVEMRVSEPLIPFRELPSSISRVLACVACGWATFGIWIYYLYIFLLKVRGHSPLVVSAELAPCAVAGIVASGVTGFLFSKGVPTHMMMAAALIGFCIPSILLATIKVQQTYWAAVFVSTIIGPFGMDISFPAATLLLSGSVPKNRQGMAASLVATVVNYSISIGLGIAGTAVQQVSPGQDMASQLKAIRTAAYVGIGLSGLGFSIAMYDVIRGFLGHKSEPAVLGRRPEANEQEKN